MGRTISIRILVFTSRSFPLAASVAPSNTLVHDENVTLPSSPFGSKVTNLTLPRWYAGLDVNPVFNRRYPLNALSLLTLGVNLMYELSQHRWTSVIESDVTMDAADDITSISVSTQVAVPEARDRLLNGAAILALYRTFETMILQNDLYEVDSEILYLGVLFGDIKAFVIRDHILLNAGTNASMTNRSDLASSLRSTSGHIIDEDDADFKITYTYESTRRINRYQFFLGFLDGLANAAEPNENDLVRDERGISPTGEAVIRIYQNYDRPGLLSYRMLKRAIFLVWDRIVLAERRFGNMRGRLEHIGVEIGTFWIHG